MLQFGSCIFQSSEETLLDLKEQYIRNSYVCIHKHCHVVFKNKQRCRRTGRISTWELDIICENGTEDGTHYIGFMGCTSSYQTRTFSPITYGMVLVAGRALQEMTRTRCHLPVHRESALRDKKTIKQKSMVRRECYKVTLTRLELAISWSEVRRLVH